MKIIATTTGNFSLMDFHKGQSNDLPVGRPAVIEKTSFYAQRIGIDQVKVICDAVPDSFTDADLSSALASGKSIEDIVAGFKKKVSKE